MELDSGADSVSSTPRSVHPKLNFTSADKSVVRLMCSFGGKILPRPHDNQLRYVGGDTRIIAVHRSITFSSLFSKLSKLLPGDFTIKYQLPNEDMDALITVSTDEDVDNMMEEFDRVPRLRLFLFSSCCAEEEDSRTSSIASLLDGSRKRESWFLDALNGGGSAGGALERGRSEASSIVSEVPDYLFGLDNSEEPSSGSGPAKFKNRPGSGGLADGDPGSPGFGLGSSGPPMPNLPPVKTKLENPKPVDEAAEPVVQPVWSGNPNPGSPFPGNAVQPIPVYYVAAGSGPGFMPHRNVVPVSVPFPGPYIPQFGPGLGPVPVQVGFPGVGSGPYEMQTQGNVGSGHGLGGLNQPLYYEVKNAGMVGPYPGAVVSMPGDEVVGSGPDSSKGRTLQA